jgi:hypothetical protein
VVLDAAIYVHSANCRFGEQHCGGEPAREQVLQALLQRTRRHGDAHGSDMNVEINLEALNAKDSNARGIGVT